MLYSIIYTSKPLVNLSSATINKICSSSVKNNKEKGISGVLVYNSQNFIQVLEGEKENVLAVFDTILEDERHEDIFKIMEGNIANRIFSEWEMASLHLDENKNIRDIIPANNRSPAAILIRRFVDMHDKI